MTSQTTFFIANVEPEGNGEYNIYKKTQCQYVRIHLPRCARTHTSTDGRKDGRTRAYLSISAIPPACNAVGLTTPGFSMQASIRNSCICISRRSTRMKASPAHFDPMYAESNAGDGEVTPPPVPVEGRKRQHVNVYPHRQALDDSGPIGRIHAQGRDCST